MLASLELLVEYLGLFDTEGALEGGPMLSRLKMLSEDMGVNIFVVHIYEI